jgi:hypothetical protein
MDREGLKSTISSGHGQSRATSRSSLLDDYNPIHGPIGDVCVDRMNRRMESIRPAADRSTWGSVESRQPVNEYKPGGHDADIDSNWKDRH